MSDVFTKEKRHEVMSKIRSKNSKAELIAFRYLREQKVYFQKHYNKAAGTPDIAVPRKKKAVFIDGDFWHGRNYEHRLRGRLSDDPWVLKIKRNIERDKEQEAQLRENNWEILRIWESDILRKSTQKNALQLISNFLMKQR